MAISSPLLEASIDGARGVLLSISGGSDLGLFEINEAAQLVSEAAHPEANIIFGAVIDDALGDEVRVTVIAAGFDGGKPPPRRRSATSVRRSRRPPRGAGRDAGPPRGAEPPRPVPSRRRPSAAGQPEPAARASRHGASGRPAGDRVAPTTSTSPSSSRSVG